MKQKNKMLSHKDVKTLFETRLTQLTSLAAESRNETIFKNKLNDYLSGVLLDGRTKGAYVDENYQTSVPGVFAAGNVLHVHDLVDFVSQEAEALANGVAAYLKEGTLTECGLTVETCPVIGHVIPQKVSGTQDFSLSFRVRRPMGTCISEVRHGDTVLTTVKLPEAIPA